MLLAQDDASSPTDIWRQRTRSDRRVVRQVSDVGVDAVLCVCLFVFVCLFVCVCVCVCVCSTRLIFVSKLSGRPSNNEYASVSASIQNVQDDRYT